MRPNTPKVISKKIISFLNSFSIHNKPVYLKFTRRSSKYMAGQCFDNCLVESKVNNCEIIFGWLIWELKELGFIEGEFHAVIKQSGKLIDITPRIDNELKVLFVPDDNFSAELKNGFWHGWYNIKSFNGKLNSTMPIKGISKIDLIK